MLFTESPAVEGSRLQNLVRRSGDMLTESFCAVGRGKTRAGVPKADAQEMSALLKDRLLMGTIVYADDLIVYDETEDAVQKKLEQQLRTWGWHKNARGQVSLHGKVAGANDDLLVTLMMIPYWAGVFNASDRTRDKQFRETARQ